MSRLRIVWGITAVLLSLFTGCVRQIEVGPTQTENLGVEIGEAQSVRATIQMGAGELLVRGWATELLDAEFTYNIPEWRPIITYNVTNGRGELTISQPEYVAGPDALPTGNIQYQWDLRFNNEVPLQLEINLGAGRSDLVLGDLHLTEAQINIGVGESTIDLTGDWRQSASITIEGGIGSASVRLPANVGVRVVAESGIGTIEVQDLSSDGESYTNDLYGQSEITLEIRVNSGIGTIRLETE